MAKQMPEYVQRILARASKEHGIPFSTLRSFAEIESGFRPGARTGSYKGLFQLSTPEFKRGGGQGSIFNPEANTNAFANVLKRNMQAFEKTMGRPPTGWEAYLVHQQGVAGGPAHLKNPDKPAWVNMYNTPEGKQKGKSWARKAIWGNIPGQQKRRFGKVDNVMSSDFTNMWKQRYARAGGGSEVEPTFDTSPPLDPGMPERGMRVADNGMDVPERRPQWMDTDQNVTMVGGGEDAPPVPDRNGGTKKSLDNQLGDTVPMPDRNQPEEDRLGLNPMTERRRNQGKLGGVMPPNDGGDNWAGNAFGEPFGDLYQRPDQGSTLLKDILPSGKPQLGAQAGGVPPRVPLFRQFFSGMFGG